MSKIKKLAGETVLYGLGSVVPRALNFLLFPLHTRVFNPEDYGAVSYLYIFAAFLNIFYTLGMETAYFRYATKGVQSPQRVFDQAQTMVMTIALAFSGLLIAFSHPIADGLALPGKSVYIKTLAGIVFIDAAVAIPFARLRLTNRPIRFAMARIANVALLLALNVYFFIWSAKEDGALTYGIAYVFVANLIANAFYVVFFVDMFRRWRPAFDGPLLAAMLRYALPIMITGLAGTINEMFSRWALKWWLPSDFYSGKSSLYALGIFSVAYKYAIVMSLAIQAFRFAAEPFFFSHARDRNSPELFARVNHIFVVVMSFIFLAVAVNLDTLKLLAGQAAYYEGAKVVPMLLCGYIFFGVHYNFSVWFKLTDKTHYGTLIALGGVCITVALNFFFIPRWGYTGSAWVSPICYLSMATACYLMGRRHFPIPYDLLRSLGYLLSAFLLAFVSARWSPAHPWWAAAFHTLLLAAFALAAYVIEIRPLQGKGKGMWRNLTSFDKS